MERPRALVVEADGAVRDEVARGLRAAGFDAKAVGDGAAAVDSLRERGVDLLLTTLADRRSAEELAGAARQRCDTLRIVGIGGEGAIGSSDEPFDVVSRPPTDDEIRRMARRAKREIELSGELRRLRERILLDERRRSIVGCSPQIDRLREAIVRLATRPVPLWISGPDGAGKEHAARAFHLGSSRAGGPFVVLDCRTIAGDDGGSFWRGGGGGPALLEQAGGGTLYLDEITALPLDLQHRLERRLEDHESIGDPLVVASSALDPAAAIDDRRLLRPLYRRLSRSALHIPALVERLEDVPLLADHFAATIASLNEAGPIRIGECALGRMLAYAWPGNVQELRNAVEHAVILAADDIVLEKHLPERIRAGVAPSIDGGSAARDTVRSFRDAKRGVVEAFERTYLRELLDRHRGNVTAAAQQAGMLRSALQRLLRKYGLKSIEFRRRRPRPAAGEAEIRPRVD